MPPRNIPSSQWVNVSIWNAAGSRDNPTYPHTVFITTVFYSILKLSISEVTLLYLFFSWLRQISAKSNLKKDDFFWLRAWGDSPISEGTLWQQEGVQGPGLTTSQSGCRAKVPMLSSLSSFSLVWDSSPWISQLIRPRNSLTDKPGVLSPVMFIVNIERHNS